jgi:hypothetical protein
MALLTQKFTIGEYRDTWKERGMARGIRQESNWNSAIENQQIQKEREMEKNLNKEHVLTQEMMLDKPNLAKMYPVFPGTVTVSAVDNIAREAWLEKTQNMRVVALNEACALFKDAKLSPTPQNVLAYARAFTDFLVDGKS